MNKYVLFIFFTGHSRLEQITPRRPAAAIVGELRARFGSQGYVKYAADITDHVGPDFPIVYSRRSRKFM
ncbi:MAG TPA: hypothetical protein VD973_09470 [Symbiobacteriaceae bacterium]|nr:hypothetical protein [Symbiobacteriaceae bacterium]